jgi:hypothetical protein
VEASSIVSVRPGRVLAFAALAALFGVPAAGTAQTETVRLAGTSVAVFNLAGHATLSPGSDAATSGRWRR